MGQKVNPIGIRLGIAKDWTSRWYAEKAEFPEYLNIDLKVRDYIRKKLAHASVSKILIERPAKTARVTIYTARPGIVIGKKGSDIERLRKELSGIMNVPVAVNIAEIRKPELDAQLVAENVAQQLERRVMFRRAMKRAMGNAMRLGAEGFRIRVGGRLNGAEIARSETYREGRVPLHTLRADVDYGLAEAMTTYGVIGVKVWIYKGEVFDLYDQPEESADEGRRGGPKGGGPKGGGPKSAGPKGGGPRSGAQRPLRPRAPASGDKPADSK